MDNKQQLPDSIMARIKEDAMNLYPPVVGNSAATKLQIERRSIYVMAAERYAALWQESERKRKEAMELLDPILEWGQSKEAEMKLGETITKVVLERATLWQQAEAEKKQLRDALDNISALCFTRGGVTFRKIKSVIFNLNCDTTKALQEGEGGK